MNFDLPIRIHWQPGDPVDPDHVRSIRDCHPLDVTLEIDKVEQLTSLDLPWEGISVVVVYQGWRDMVRCILPGVAQRWEFPIQGPAEAKALTDASFLGLSPAETSFRWFPRKGHLKDLVPILQSVADAGCGLTLPNRPAGDITSEGQNVFPGEEDLSGEVLGELSAFAKVLQSDHIRVHDFILTEALDLEWIEPLGCEAGNSLAFIDSWGKVYPCETLLIPMGDLGREGLGTIWASPLRQRIRKEVELVPETCSSCPDLVRCRGGCRGAVYHLMGHFGAPDPQCLIDLKDNYE